VNRPANFDTLGLGGLSYLQWLRPYRPFFTGGAVAFDHAAHMAIPLRIGVMEGSEHDPHSKATHVMYDRPSALFARYQGLETVASGLDGILERIVAAVASRGGMKMEGQRPEHEPGQTGKPGR